MVIRPAGHSAGADGTQAESRPHPHAEQRGTYAPTVRFVVTKGAVAPEYASRGSAGADLRAFIDDPIILHPNERTLIPTGLSLEIPDGWEGQVRPRSGLAVKHGVTVLNSPGTIDADYRGEVKVILINTGTESFTVQPGDRIAQLIITPVYRVTFKSVASLQETTRGAGGFGSTGVSD